MSRPATEPTGQSGPGDGAEPRSTPADVDELAGLATSLARRAGQAIVELREGALTTVATKSSPTDPVTEADRAAEAIVVGGIEAARPEDAIVGEEGTERSGTSGLEWYVDPIDGTTNYVYGVASYSVSIAAADRGAPLCGVVYNPVTDELFAATAGGGATLDGRPITVAGLVELSAALVFTGFSYRAEVRQAQARVMADLLPEIRDIRRLGSAALDLCAVACGRADAYFEVGLNVWDFAAGALIATEAGALCTDLAGGPPSSTFILAAPPDLHRVLGDRLRALGADDVGF